MKLTKLHTLTAAVVGLAFFAGHVSGTATSAQDENPMEVWQELMKTGPKHEAMAPMAGTFDADATFWMMPGAPPMKTRGTIVNELVHGGRFLTSEYDSNFMGTPFKGTSAMGYSNLDKTYQSIWYDSMNTRIAFSTGEVSEGGATFEFTSTEPDPMQGGMVTVHDRIVIESADKHTFVRHMGEGEERTKMMEIVYTRSAN